MAKSKNDELSFGIDINTEDGMKRALSELQKGLKDMSYIMKKNPLDLNIATEKASKDAIKFASNFYSKLKDIQSIGGNLNISKKAKSELGVLSKYVDEQFKELKRLEDEAKRVGAITKSGLLSKRGSKEKDDYTEQYIKSLDALERLSTRTKQFAAEEISAIKKKEDQQKKADAEHSKRVAEHIAQYQKQQQEYGKFVDVLNKADALSDKESKRRKADFDKQNTVNQNTYNEQKKQGLERQRILKQESDTVEKINAKLKVQRELLSSSKDGSNRNIRINHEIALLEQRKKKIQEEERAQKKINDEYRKRVSILRSNETSLDAINAKIKLQQERLRATTGGTPKNERLKDELTRLSVSYDRLKESQGTIETQTRRVSGAFREQGKVVNSLTNLASRYIGIYSLMRVGREIINTTKDFEMQRVALGALVRDTTSAQKIFGQIKSLAVQSPFQVGELVSYTKQLAAYRIETELLFDTTKRLADISAGLGVDMSRLILAYGQVKSASVLRGQELRQFTEAGIPLVQLLADKFTKLRGEMVSTGDVFQLISKRAVSFELVKEIFEDMTNAGGMFYQMQETQSRTLKGSISNLKDEFALMYDEIGRGQISFIKGLVDLSKFLVGNWETVGRIASVVGVIYFANSKLMKTMTYGYVLNAKQLTDSIIKEKMYQTLQLNRAKVYRKLTAEETAFIATRNQLTKADLRAAVVSKTLTRDMAMQLYSKKMLTEENMRYLVSLGLVKKAELETVIIRKTHMRIIHSMWAGLKNATIQAWAFTKAMLFNPVTIALAAIVAAITLITRRISKQREEQERLNKSVANSLNTLVRMKDGYLEVSDAIDKAFGSKSQQTIQDAIDKLEDLVGQNQHFIALLHQGTEGLTERLDVLKKIKENYEEIVKGIEDSAQKVVQSSFSSSEKETGGFFDKDVTENAGKLTKAIDNVKSKLNDIIPTTESAKRALNQALKIDTSTIEGVKEFQKAVNKLYSELKDSGASKSAFSGIFTPLVEFETDFNTFVKSLKKKNIFADLDFGLDVKKMEDGTVKSVSRLTIQQQAMIINAFNEFMATNEDMTQSAKDLMTSQFEKSFGIMKEAPKETLDVWQEEFNKYVAQVESSMTSVDKKLNVSINQYSKVDQKQKLEEINSLLSERAERIAQVGAADEKAFKGTEEEKAKYLQQLNEEVKSLELIRKWLGYVEKERKGGGGSGRRGVEMEIKKLKEQLEIMKQYVSSVKELTKSLGEAGAIQYSRDAFGGRAAEYDLDLSQYKGTEQELLKFYTDTAILVRTKFNEIIKDGIKVFDKDDFSLQWQELYNYVRELESGLRINILEETVKDQVDILNTELDKVNGRKGLEKYEKQFEKTMKYLVSFADNIGLADVFDVTETKWYKENQSKKFIKDVSIMISEIEKEFELAKSRIDLFDFVRESTGSTSIGLQISAQFHGEGIFDIGEQISNDIESLLAKGGVTFDITPDIDIDSVRNAIDQVETAEDESTEAIKKSLDGLLGQFISYYTSRNKEVLKSLAKEKDYEDKRTDIMRKGAMERKAINEMAISEPEKKELKEQSLKKEKSELDVEAVKNFKGSALWERTFSSLDTASRETLELLKKRIEEIKETMSDSLKPTEMRELMKSYEDITDKLENRDFIVLIKAAITPPDTSQIDADIANLTEAYNKAMENVGFDRKVLVSLETEKLDTETLGEEKITIEDQMMMLEVKELLNEQEQEALESLREQYALTDALYKLSLQTKDNKVAQSIYEKRSVANSKQASKLSTQINKKTDEKVDLEEKHGKAVKAAVEASKKLWADTQSVTESLKGLFQAIGVSTDSVFSKSIDLFQTIGEGAISIIDTVAVSAAQGISKVEKASIILTIISVALQVITKIVSIFDKTKDMQARIDQLSGDIDFLKEAYEKLNFQAISDPVQLKRLETEIAMRKDLMATTIEQYSKINQGVDREKTYALTISAALKGNAAIAAKGLISLIRSKKINENMAELQRLQNVRIEHYNQMLQISNSGMTDAQKASAMMVVNLERQNQKIREQLKLEMSKKPKDQDMSKVMEYQDQIVNNEMEKMYSNYTVLTENIGDLFSELKDSISDALLTAWENGESGADAFDQSVNTAMRSVIKNLFKMNVLPGLMKGFMEKFYTSMGFSPDGRNDGKADFVLDKYEAAALKQEAEAAKGNITTAFDSLNDVLSYFGDNDSNLSGLAKGIASASEESVTVLAGYWSSTLHYTVLTWSILDRYEKLGFTSATMDALARQQVLHLAAIELNTYNTVMELQLLNSKLDNVITPKGGKKGYVIQTEL